MSAAHKKNNLKMVGPTWAHMSATQQNIYGGAHMGPTCHSLSPLGSLSSSPSSPQCAPIRGRPQHRRRRRGEPARVGRGGRRRRCSRGISRQGREGEGWRRRWRGAPMRIVSTSVTAREASREGGGSGDGVTRRRSWRRRSMRRHSRRSLRRWVRGRAAPAAAPSSPVSRRPPRAAPLPSAAARGRGERAERRLAGAPPRRRGRLTRAPRQRRERPIGAPRGRGRARRAGQRVGGRRAAARAALAKGRPTGAPRGMRRAHRGSWRERSGGSRGPAGEEAACAGRLEAGSGR